jgi:hypothetical protein
MALIPPRRAFRLNTSSVGDLYRAMFSSAGGSDTGVLDVASAVPGGQYACFERAVLGWESLSEPITGPQNSHLVWDALFLHETRCRPGARGEALPKMLQSTSRVIMLFVRRD